MPPLTKEALRQEILSRKQAGDLPDAGRTAERLRKLTPYRKALCVLCSPARELQQVRLNTLADGKKLLLPTPFLQKGFLFLDPRGISPSKRLKAAQHVDGLWKWARLLLFPVVAWWIQGDEIRALHPDWRFFWTFLAGVLASKPFFQSSAVDRKETRP